MRSERATYVCWFNWLSASPKPALKDRAKKMVDTAKSILAAMPNNERNQYSPKPLQESIQKWKVSADNGPSFESANTLS